MKKLLTLSAITCATLAPTAMAAEEVNVYSYRQPFLVEPMFNEFTKETGIKVNTYKAEGNKCPICWKITKNKCERCS